MHTECVDAIPHSELHAQEGCAGDYPAIMKSLPVHADARGIRDGPGSRQRPGHGPPPAQKGHQTAALSERFSLASHEGHA